MKPFAKIDLASKNRFTIYIKVLLLKRDVGTKKEQKAHVPVDRLHFNTEGYTWAKNILTSWYSNVSEVVNALVKTIVTLLIGHGSHPIHIHKFYEKLLAHVKSLEKWENLIQRVCGNTLDKLLQNRSYLVRSVGE